MTHSRFSDSSSLRLAGLENEIRKKLENIEKEMTGESS